MIAEQIPARLVPDVIKNTAVKIAHRLPAADDREAVGATMNATPPQSRYLVTLPPGQAAVFSDGMDFPVLVQVKDGTERERASPAPTADARTRGPPPVGQLRRRMRASAVHAAGHARRPASCSTTCRGSRLWAELAVLAHLTGWPMPVPVPDALAAACRRAAARRRGWRSARCPTPSTPPWPRAR